MILTIYRGTHEIGGSCVEVQAEGERIVLDLGMPLVNRDGSPFEMPKGERSTDDLLKGGVLPNVPGLYARGSTPPLAVILSHAHQDHYGFAGFATPDVPVFLTAGTKALIEASALFLPHKVRIPNTVILPKWKPVQIGPFRVTSYLVDHSAPDAVALLIEAGGKRVLYSGDLRRHGRKGVLFERLVKRPPPRIDVFLLEGTMMGRGDSACSTEQEVEIQVSRVLRAQTNVALLFCSSQNVDRLVSAYRAVLRTRRLLIIDLYTAFVLDALRTVSNRLPQWDSERVKVKHWPQHRKSLEQSGQDRFLERLAANSVRMDFICRYRRKILLLTKSNCHFTKLASRLAAEPPGLEGLEIIWSQWAGYWNTDKFVRPYCEKHGLQRRQIHTSGHASTNDLKQLADAIGPKMIIPIHTFHPGDYVHRFKNVVVAYDGVPLTF